MTAPTSPRRLSAYLDDYFVGQTAAKKALAVTLFNRLRARKITLAEMRAYRPDPLLLWGPPGTGKTELVRKAAEILELPFLRIPARQVLPLESGLFPAAVLVRELLTQALTQLRRHRRRVLRKRAVGRVEEKLVELLLTEGWGTPQAIREHLRDPRWRRKEIIVEYGDKSPRPASAVNEVLNSGNRENGTRPEPLRLTLAEAEEMLLEQELDRMLALQNLGAEALELVRSRGLVFIDDLEQAFSPEAGENQPGCVSVAQILPSLLEGLTVTTPYGTLDTGGLLYIAAGSQNNAVGEPGAELLAFFPHRVELTELSSRDFERLLLHSHNSPLIYYRELLAAEGVRLEWEEAALRRLARWAEVLNQRLENLGAGRLRSILSHLLEDVLYRLPESRRRRLRITVKMVEDALRDVFPSEDLSRFVL